MSEETKNNTNPKPESDIERLTRECQEYLNGWKRAKADLINFQADEEKRMQDVRVFANNTFARDLLAVIDSFQLAQSSIGSNEQAQKGLALIKAQLEEVLKRHGIERIEVKKGDALNLNFHEVLQEVELDPAVQESALLEGKIIHELFSGYQVRGRVIRAAKVAIGKLKT